MSGFTEALQQISEGRRSESSLLDDYGSIVGIDEAGRGAFAGPMYVGGCRVTDLRKDWMEGVEDSKALTVHRRQQIARQIKEGAEDWIVVAVEPWTIDAQGISSCLNACVRYVANELRTQSTLAAFDGSDQPTGVEADAINVLRGDARFISIGAASILAKTAHDSYMAQMSFEYPGYGFEDNVGYGTGQHRVAIRKLGTTPVHRQSFGPLDGMDDTWEGNRVESARQVLNSPAVDDQPTIHLVSRK